ncbi:MAG TPA: HAD hydrolase-like protein [Noviherbaspirillum sp.]|jgi:beta-phosphoglucomutase-like phosphatase (HAD superfamily)|uniref:HAD family hydrolase n=1 Tax=Noviherbaspirillum sp. TaxID=1926288 RepID=UPI002F9535E9
MAIEALILALDGVIFDTEQAHLDACNAAFAECGVALQWSLGQFREAARLHGASRAIVQAGRSMAPNVAAALQEAAEAGFRRRLQAQPPARHAGCTSLMEEAIASGCKLAVVTEMSSSCADALLQQAFGNDVNNTFAVVVGGARFIGAAGAPQDDAHRLAMRTMAVDPEQCAAVDAAVPGLAAAQRAGIWTMASTPYARDVARISGADLWCPQLQELRDLIGRQGVPADRRYVSFSTLRSLKHGQLGQRPVLRRPVQHRPAA